MERAIWPDVVSLSTHSFTARGIDYHLLKSFVYHASEQNEKLISICAYPYPATHRKASWSVLHLSFCEVYI